VVLRQLNEFDSAERHCRTAVSLAPTDPTAPFNFGILQLEQFKYTQAAKSFSQALKVSGGTDPDAYHSLAVLLHTYTVTFAPHQLASETSAAGNVYRQLLGAFHAHTMEVYGRTPSGTHQDERMGLFYCSQKLFSLRSCVFLWSLFVFQSAE
jgi:tetratricopeptide (TPR) repeat protein